MNEVTTKKSSVVQFICVVTKQYIYSQRCLGKQLSFQEVKAKISKLKSIEKYIAVKNNKVDLYIKKWERSMGTVQTHQEYIQGYVENVM